MRSRLIAALAALLVPLVPAAAQPAPERPPRVGIVLASGAARGFAYLGALEVLVEDGIPVDALVGTSAGAVVAGLYSAGYSADTIVEILAELDTRELLRFLFPPVRGLVDPSAFVLVYRALVGNLRIERADPPLAVMATELRPGPSRGLRAGDLAAAVRASISLPVVFPAAEFEGRSYIDGAYRNPLPVDVARALGADVVVSLRSAPEGSAVPASVVDTLSLTVYALVAPAAQEVPDASVQVRLDDTLYFDFENAGRLVRRGREAARHALPELRRVLLARGVALRPPGDPHASNPVNALWRERLARGLAAARALPRPFSVWPLVELGPSSYDWGARAGAPASFAALGLGVLVEGGPLGPFGVGGGLVRPFGTPGPSGFLRLAFAPAGPFEVTATLDPYRRPAGAPWEVAASYRAGGWAARLSADLLAVGLEGRRTLRVGETTATLGAELRVGYEPSARLEARASLEWRPESGPWSVRGRLLGGLATGGAQGFALGGSAGLRAYADAFLLAPQAGIANLEVGYRLLEVPSLAGIASAGVEVRVFADAGGGAGAFLWDVGLGVTADAQLFGLVGVSLGADAAFAPGAFRVSLFTRALLP